MNIFARIIWRQRELSVFILNFDSRMWDANSRIVWNVLTRSTRTDEAHHIIKKGFALTRLVLQKHWKGGRVLLIYITSVGSIQISAPIIFSCPKDVLDLLINFGDNCEAEESKLTTTKSLMKLITRFSGAHSWNGRRVDRKLVGKVIKFDFCIDVRHDHSNSISGRLKHEISQAGRLQASYGGVQVKFFDRIPLSRLKFN